eukprot:9471951-Lingulodinium_polyedra.AAC.1
MHWQKARDAVKACSVRWKMCAAAFAARDARRKQGRQTQGVRCKLRFARCKMQGAQCNVPDTRYQIKNAAGKMLC